MITNYPLWMPTISPDEVLAARALDNSPIRSLLAYSSHLEQVHEGLHLAAALFGVDPDPDTCRKVGERLTEVDNYIDKVLDAMMN